MVESKVVVEMIMDAARGVILEKRVLEVVVCC
jgi:hypothetical protein